MVINFRINYVTAFGEHIRIKFTSDSSFESDFHYLEFITYDGENWIGQLLYEDVSPIYYKYEVLKNRVIYEEGLRPRLIDAALDLELKSLHIRDYWKAPDSEKNLFYSSAFTDILFARKTKQTFSTNSSGRFYLEFNLAAPDIPQNAVVGVVGNQSYLGNWSKPLILSDARFPIWHGATHSDESYVALEYKYVLLDVNTKEIIYWETGPNRAIYHQFPDESGYGIILNDEFFKFAGPWWRGSGMAFPVFALRSKESFGIGEFSDLTKAIDLVSNCGMNMVQILPVNDTIANKTWMDSYPYAAISVFALNPMYIHIPGVGKLKKKDQSLYNIYKSQLQELDKIDFEKVLTFKLEFLNILFKQEGQKCLESEDFQIYFEANKWWLKDYGSFCALRDHFQTPDFNQWQTFAEYNAELISEMWEETSTWYQQVSFYAFIQYHLDKQLLSAKNYGRTKGVVLKGDLPIGIYRYSCDAWTNPQLYHMDQQAGAPPDDYAVNGQNWGFPTYNWKEMSLDNYDWWQKRMHKLAEHFDALRIDHILGFFRIWSIPIDEVSGTLGKFYPRLPYSIGELAAFGLKGDINRYSKPYIRKYYLPYLFGAHTPFIIDNFLDEVFHEAYLLKPQYSTQSAIVRAFESPELVEYQDLANSVCYLLSEVLFIEEETGEGIKYNPRITLHTTYSYRNLDEMTRRSIDRLYIDYFYSRHSQFWKSQALAKLPVLLKATNMLICGEDLGMIPETVPEVMDDLHILTLEIQRMPKQNALFGNCAHYPYESVCSPSCHDMSTIRGWWEANVSTAQAYYNMVMGKEGQAPRLCTSDIVQAINKQHLDAPSMLAIFPIQDLLGMEDRLKKEDPFSEQINEPSNPKHYWRYRLHVELETLIDDVEFCNKVKTMVRASGR
ncbi:MAG: 4-alpha-glucanotransferase [Saprospiraceae bacterium]|nr:4-alpha-glucanotransferase [Saprospiraceae bacterium]